MPADFITEFRRPLDVNFIPDLNIAEIGNPQRLFHEIKADARAVDVGHRQTATVVGYRCPGFEPSSICAGQLHHVVRKLGLSSMETTFAVP